MPGRPPVRERQSRSGNRIDLSVSADANSVGTMWDTAVAWSGSDNRTSPSVRDQPSRENPSLPGFVDADSALAITRKVQVYETTES